MSQQKEQKKLQKLKTPVQGAEVPIWCAHGKIVHVDDLIPNPKNPNTHPEKQIELLAKIIKLNGWRAPVVVSIESGMVSKGHGRILAAKINNFKYIPVDYQHYESPEAEYADMVADNKIQELSKVDMEMVLDEIGMLGDDFDIGSIGIDEIKFSDNNEPISEETINEQWILAVECKNENQLAKLHGEMKKRGFECKLIT